MQPHGSWPSVGRGKKRCVRSLNAFARSWSGKSPHSGLLTNSEERSSANRILLRPVIQDTPSLKRRAAASGMREAWGFRACLGRRRQPAWLVDVQDDEDAPADRLPRRREDCEAPLPFRYSLGGEVFGVMEFFSRGVRPPDEDVLEMTAAVGRQIGQFIEQQVG